MERISDGVWFACLVLGDDLELGLRGEQAVDDTSVVGAAEATVLEAMREGAEGVLREREVTLVVGEACQPDQPLGHVGVLGEGVERLGEEPRLVATLGEVAEADARLVPVAVDHAGDLSRLLEVVGLA